MGSVQARRNWKLPAVIRSKPMPLRKRDFTGLQRRCVSLRKATNGMPSVSQSVIHLKINEVETSHCTHHRSITRRAPEICARHHSAVAEAMADRATDKLNLDISMKSASTPT